MHRRFRARASGAGPGVRPEQALSVKDRRQPVLSVKDLQVEIAGREASGMALDRVSFDLYPGETLALVGESGSGKSMTALTVMGLHPQPAARVVGGEVLFAGENLLGKSQEYMADVRGNHIAMILQDPLSALNPVMTIGDQVGEGLRRHKKVRGRELRDEVVDLLKLVRIPSAETRVEDYPHHFSGGMRQRVVGAIGISCTPEVLIADEPTTGLDVTVEAAYLSLLRRLQRETGVAILFITHDFGIVARMADRVAVMYAGRVVETAPKAEIFARPGHPYTQALIDSVPDVGVRPGARLRSIEGNPPSLFGRPAGCPFTPRCPNAMDRCATDVPPPFELADSQHANCWLHA
jgi:oligopeptide/dipeptide ABC transporter ATP-binding protein